MKRRFILVGFDGCNPERVEDLLPDLPNFRRLIQTGCWGPMLSTIPADTPTNWTALATGATAATSKITGFAFHRPGNSLRVEARPNAKDYPEFRAAEFIWEAADRQGLTSLAINYPFAWHSAELQNAVIVGGDQIQAGWDHLYLQMHANDSHSHRLLGHLLPEFPLATPESTGFAQRMIRENYIETDRILGDMAALAEKSGALLVVVSDHSAIPTHTWVDTGRPFMEKGWLAFDAEGNWDPTRSKVRQMINHSIYINLKGRQPDGIVAPEDYERVRDGVISTLIGMRDPKTGACPIAIAARREDMDGVGGKGDGFGDVIYFMRPGYTNQPGSEATQLTEAALGRVSDPAEALATGYTAHEWIQGNHHDYLPNAEYPGFGSNRAVLLVHGPGAKQGHRIRGARTIDVAPTLARYAGIEPPAQAEGHALVELFED